MGGKGKMCIWRIIGRKAIVVSSNGARTIEMKAENRTELKLCLISAVAHLK